MKHSKAIRRKTEDAKKFEWVQVKALTCEISKVSSFAFQLAVTQHCTLSEIVVVSWDSRFKGKRWKWMRMEILPSLVTAHLFSLDLNTLFCRIIKKIWKKVFYVSLKSSAGKCSSRWEMWKNTIKWWEEWDLKTRGNFSLCVIYTLARVKWILKDFLEFADWVIVCGWYIVHVKSSPTEWLKWVEMMKSLNETPRVFG